MNLTDAEHHVFAYYVAGPASDFDMAGRFFPMGELILMVEDKMRMAVRKFGFVATSRANAAAKALLDLLVERGAFSTTTNDFGGTMHQFQSAEYKRVLADLRENDPVIVKAKEAGEGYWAQAFERLSA